MSYQELIAKALNGRSVNKAAKDWGMPQKTLDRYTKDRLPDYHTAWKMAEEAGMEPGEVFALLADEEAKRKGIEMDPLRQNKKLPIDSTTGRQK
ncbi:hypothetical protein [Cupriavidus sp.]|uniref:hypothetical protein n=1 Tax=Cupriavidus sp. TaxID=1873897 RepID=UPI0025C27396|nr:hypothetical protein [Cupriavidus sp.]MCA3182640.1 hypothetical protein [Cupriavidus sp.]MCA3193005.1 hypothetical protein [Cupriavidus sp.]MCA3195857.1 hypothetical protein [Cupriavidus sp.]MCA3204758.1 hypothetical protein [Cupriavidus sp.]MCA3206890.1 hypothetical protein [Cupriavidus sp.]